MFTQRPVITGIACLCSSGFVANASAQFVAPTLVDDGWERGVTAESIYAEWDSFVSPFANPNPDAGLFVGGTLPPSASGFDVVDITGFSFVTSTGNLYSFSEVTAFDVTVPGFGLGAGFETTVVMQTRVLGVPIDEANVRIGDELVDVIDVLVDGTTEEGQGGVDRWTRFEWTLPGNTESYVISFEASSSSLSLLRLAVDTFVTPVAGGCNPADLAQSDGSFGTLDFNDIDAFVSAFLAEDAVGDLNSDMAFDFQDIELFVVSFLAGCP